MYVRRLELVDFRSYPRVVVEFEPGPGVFVGSNGVGKTNLVEALGYVATLSSHRVSTDAPLVRIGAQRAVVRCAVVHEGRELLVELQIEPGKANKARLGRAPTTRPRDILGALRLVLFAPEDLSLVRGEPEGRRRFLDDLLVARQPRFAAVRSDYERVLKQRNALLRTAYLTRRVKGSGGDLSTLDVWDAHLAEHGSRLWAARLELTAALAPHVERAYDAVAAGKGTARVRYHSRNETTETAPQELEKVLAEALKNGRPQEVERGVTLAGPHRDDLSLLLGEMPVKGYASHGESWSFALAMKLAAYELLRAEGIEPVLVLDDVFAELDAGRRERLADLVGGAEQVLVTCAVDADVPARLRGARYAVREGEVEHG
ncbi:DNA replication and repair protein RecF [Virgisporangium aliadipatigenens]|uniref:DNA replication and repair protein RecF n=1 Tax=Virgisporangium aliadipatigenens TaxID=741659 RepID=A0A8J3YP05_9ACTN|nr:DNA replication/repair protein RecF [Virgisporangium aliadipatigenens]GIJ47153.1 DNA replication and repair protein RecF [Virgisporangium aliadipatigenens]